MKIAIVVEVFLPKRDGVTITVERVLNYLRSQNHEVLILAPGASVATCAGYEVVCAGGFPLLFYPGLRYNTFDIPMARRLLEFKPDVIQLFDPIMLGLQTYYFARFFMPRTPLIYTYCTNIVMYTTIFGFPQLAHIFWAMQKIMHRNSSLTMVPSNSIKHELTYHDFTGDITVWPRPVDSRRFHPSKRREDLRVKWSACDFSKPTYPENKIILLFVSRISWEKGLNTLRNAYEGLDKSRFHLVFVGDGPARQELEPDFPPGDVTFVGWRQGDELAEAYASADIFVFASLTETFGNVLLEAAASGLPIVACDALGVRDLVLHGKTGLLGPAADSNAMRQNILRIANDEKLMERMSLEARTFAERYTNKFSFDIVSESYNTVMAKKSVTRKAAFLPRAWDILRLMFLNNLMIIVGLILCVYKILRYGRARPIPTRDMPVFA